jgi:hypothetical protein
MILTIPYQALEISNIHLTPFTYDKYGKSIARLSYKDNSIDFQDVCILSPPLKVIDYNPESSRLRLDLSEQQQFLNKLHTLQNYLTSTFFIHQQSFLSITNKSQDYVSSLFNFLLADSVLNLYIFPTANVKKEDGSTLKVAQLKTGDTIRCVIRLHGISQIFSKSGAKLRLQHSIPSIWGTF